MFKVVIKQIFMVILLLIAIAIILGIIFYEYIPTNKVLPAKVQKYELPNDVQNELNESVLAGENVIKTYQIDAQDLKIYESSKSYSKGKINPFEKDSSNTTNTTNTNSTNQTDNSIVKKTLNK